MLKQKSSKTSLVFKVISLLAITFGLYKGVQYYMYHEKVNNLYRHGFRMFEEQIATYIVDHYSGISKIEFSPIFVDGDGVYTMRTANIVPVLYDEQGNHALLGGTVGNHSYSSYGLNSSFSLDFDYKGDELIELYDDNGELIEVQYGQPLPDEVNYSEWEGLDSNIEALVGDNQLVGIEKSKSGSPNAIVSYNTEILKGNYWEWTK